MHIYIYTYTCLIRMFLLLLLCFASICGIGHLCCVRECFRLGRGSFLCLGRGECSLNNAFDNCIAATVHVQVGVVSRTLMSISLEPQTPKNFGNTNLHASKHMMIVMMAVNDDSVVEFVTRRLSQANFLKQWISCRKLWDVLIAWSRSVGN